jgi:predicted glycoside hydrolase/deacetylase ChbG (UPF0249 family)
LILNCGDLGMHEAVNIAIFDSIDDGVATSCSLMVSCPGAADAIRVLRERPHLPFGPPSHLDPRQTKLHMGTVVAEG